ncbi:MAG: acylneuraminate cytidylyltransferase family protein [bacterium]
MRILTTIAARGGSKGVKDKNIRNLAGKPLIAYTIEQIIRWNKFDKFIISTDSDKIADIARSYGVDIPFMRLPELAGDNVGKLDVLRHALIEADKYYDRRFDAVLDLDATAPVRTIEDIDNIVERFKEKKVDCVFSVVAARKNPYFNMVEVCSGGNVSICKKNSGVVTSRQDSPRVYEMNASMYVYAREFLLDKNNKNPYSKSASIYEMKEVSRVDIDNEIDFKFIEFLIKKEIVKI